MTDLKLAFGATRSLPEGVSTAWGARWIWPNDMVWDRQDLSGPNADALKAWLNDGGIESARDVAATLAASHELKPDESRTVTLYSDETGRIIANPQRSHGYLYVAAWLREDVPRTEPQFKPGDRFWTHYDYQWGTVVKIDTTYRDQTHGVTGDPLPDTTWYEVRYDDGATSLLDDAHGNWDMARMVPPHIAERYGYGSDPKAVV